MPHWTENSFEDQIEAFLWCTTETAQARAGTKGAGHLLTKTVLSFFWTAVWLSSKQGGQDHEGNLTVSRLYRIRVYSLYLLVTLTLTFPKRTWDINSFLVAFQHQPSGEDNRAWTVVIDLGIYFTFDPPTWPDPNPVPTSRLFFSGDLGPQSPTMFPSFPHSFSPTPSACSTICLAANLGIEMFLLLGFWFKLFLFQTHGIPAGREAQWVYSCTIRFYRLIDSFMDVLINLFIPQVFVLRLFFQAGIWKSDILSVIREWKSLDKQGFHNEYKRKITEGNNT